MYLYIENLLAAIFIFWHTLNKETIANKMFLNYNMKVVKVAKLKTLLQYTEFALLHKHWIIFNIKHLYKITQKL